MAWPKELNSVSCIGFNKDMLPRIKSAIDSGKVVWGQVRLYNEACFAEFTWAGCRWTLHEFTEVVSSITLVDCRDATPELTAAVLQSNISAS